MGGCVLLVRTEPPLQSVMGIVVSPDGTKIVLVDQAENGR